MIATLFLRSSLSSLMLCLMSATAPVVSSDTLKLSRRFAAVLLDGEALLIPAKSLAWGIVCSTETKEARTLEVGRLVSSTAEELPGERPRGSGEEAALCSNMARRFRTPELMSAVGADCCQQCLWGVRVRWERTSGSTMWLKRRCEMMVVCAPIAVTELSGNMGFSGWSGAHHLQRVLWRCYK